MPKSQRSDEAGAWLVKRRRFRCSCSSLLHFYSPLYSTEVMEEAIEPLSQSLSMFLLDALLSTGNESMEQTDPALEDNQVSTHYCIWTNRMGGVCSNLNTKKEI